MKKITLLREKRGWSKSELSRRARMTPADVGRIESGRLQPYESQLRKLALALEISEDQAHTLLTVVEVTR